MPLPPAYRRFKSCLLLLEQVTKQTGPAGKPVNTLYIASKLDLAKEMYFAILLDRKSAGTMIIACGEGKYWAKEWRPAPVTPCHCCAKYALQCAEGLRRHEVGLLQSSYSMLEGMLHHICSVHKELWQVPRWCCRNSYLRLKISKAAVAVDA